MNSVLFAPLCTLSVLVGMFLCLEVGRRMGLRRRSQAADGAVAGSGAMEGAVFALLGRLVALSFSGAAGRFDTRRQLIVEETNAVGTASVAREEHGISNARSADNVSVYL